MCPQCGRMYADDLMFCLQDGSVLAPDSAAAAAEEPTVVRAPRRTNASPAAAATGPARRSRGWLKWALPAVLLLIGAAVAAIVAILFLRPMLVPSSDDQAAVPANTAPSNRQRPVENRPPPPSPTPSPARTETPARSEERRDVRNSDEAPAEDDDGGDRFTDPGPARITFSRGAVGETVTGRIAGERSFLLYTMAGQRLNARVQSPDGCVKFAGGGTSTSFSTSQGDSRVTIVNNCDRPARFTLSVTVR